MKANVLQGEKEKCIAAGMSDYSTKPFSAKELDALIRKHVAIDSSII
jgi:CheY-like chemotaxis protein